MNWAYHFLIVFFSFGIANEKFDVQNSNTGWCEENQGVGYYSGNALPKKITKNIF